DLTAGGNLTAGSVTSTTGSVSIDSSGGGLAVTTLASALGASLSARDTLQIDSVQVSTKLDLAAANVLVNVKQVPGSGQPLQLNLTGYQGGGANNIEMHIAPISGVVINQLHSDNATFSTDVGNVSIVNGYMPGTLSLTTPFVTLYQNNRSPSLLPVDIQLYQPSAQFKFGLSGKKLMTDSYVLNYGFGSTVNVTNYDFGHVAAKLNVNGVSAVIDAGTKQSMFTWLLAQPAALMFKSQYEMSNTFMSVSPEGGVNFDQIAPASTLSDLLQKTISYSPPKLPAKERS
ncbi:MAG: hypothetical protein PF495_12260, partial [Spirochaetales bacterium]|nr:hypothetical protein [Spirochaetales bacterium]